MDATPFDASAYADVKARLVEIGLLDDPALLAETAELFATDAVATLRLMQDAFAAGDSSALDRSAHRLKGAALNLGMSTIAEPARRIEEQARRGEFAGAPEALTLLESEIAALSAWLRRFAAPPSTSA